METQINRSKFIPQYRRTSLGAVIQNIDSEKIPISSQTTLIFIEKPFARISVCYLKLASHGAAIAAGNHS